MGASSPVTSPRRVSGGRPERPLHMAHTLLGSQSFLFQLSQETQWQLLTLPPSTMSPASWPSTPLSRECPQSWLVLLWSIPVFVHSAAQARTCHAKRCIPCMWVLHRGLFAWLCRYWPEKKLRICVTGAGGFIASHLAKRLKSEGHYLVCSDWKRNSFMPVRARSRSVEAGHRCTQLVWSFDAARPETPCVYATACLCLTSTWGFAQSTPRSLGLFRTVPFGFDLS